MGYTTGHKWTDAEIAMGIRDMVDNLGLERIQLQ